MVPRVGPDGGKGLAATWGEDREPRGREEPIQTYPGSQAHEQEDPPGHGQRAISITSAVSENEAERSSKSKRRVRVSMSGMRRLKQDQEPEQAPRHRDAEAKQEGQVLFHTLPLGTWPAAS